MSTGARLAARAANVSASLCIVLALSVGCASSSDTAATKGPSSGGADSESMGGEGVSHEGEPLDTASGGDPDAGGASADGGSGGAPASGGTGNGGSPGVDRSACKRGVSYGYHSQADLSVLSKGVSWWYNWALRPDEDLRGGFYREEQVDFVPMIWGESVVILQISVSSGQLELASGTCSLKST